MSETYDLVREMLFEPAWLGVLLYWLPVVVNLPVYVVRTFRGLRRDIKHRNNPGSHGYVTVGTLVGRFLFTFCPFVNGVALVTDTAWSMVKGVFSALIDALDMPVIPQADRAQRRPR